MTNSSATRLTIPMAKKELVIPALAAVGGVTPWTVGKTLRVIRADGMAGPKHGATARLDQFDYAAMLLGLAARRPCEAVAAVKAARTLEHTQGGGGGSLDRVLAADIEWRAQLFLDGALARLEDGIEIVLSLDPPEAWVRLDVENDMELRQHWVPQTDPPWLPDSAPAPEPPRDGRRLAIITEAMLNVAARCLAGTFARQAETRNGVPPRTPPTRNQDRPLGPTQPTPRRKYTAAVYRPQALSGRGPGQISHDQEF